MPLVSNSAMSTVTDADGTRQLEFQRIECADGCIRFLLRHSFHRHADVVDEIPLSDIANVRTEKNIVQFVKLRDGLIQRVYRLLLSRKKRDELLRVLPETTVEEAYVPEYAAALQEISEYQAALESGVPTTWLSYLIMAACIVLFGWMCFSGADPIDPAVESLLAAGGNFAPDTLSGEWWRLLSSGFVHCGVMHLAFNMYVLFSAGRLAERFFGHLLFGMIYLGSLLGGSLLSVAVHDNIVSAGASGALFGTFGAIFAYMLRNKGAVPAQIRKATLKSVGTCIVLNLLYGLKAGIDNWCHAGGLVAGFVCGLVAAFPPDTTDRNSATLPRFLLLAVLLPAFFIPAYHDLQKRQNPFIPTLRQYDAIVGQFIKDHPDRTEFPDNADPETQISFLEGFVSEVLDPQIELLETVPRQRLSTEQASILDRFVLLSKTRKEATELHVKAIRDDSLGPQVAALYEKARKIQEEIESMK